MSLLQTLKSLVNERLSAAAEEIFGTIGSILTEYEDEAFRLKQEIARHRSLLDADLKLGTELHQTADIQKLPLCKSCPAQQERNSSLVQEEPDPLQIEEEPDEMLFGPEEGLTLLAVKCEDDVAIANRVTGPAVASTSTENKTTQADAEDCGTVEHDDNQLVMTSYPLLTDQWEETGEYQSALKILKSHKTIRVEGYDLSHDVTFSKEIQSTSFTGKDSFSCTCCGKMFNGKGTLNMCTFCTMINTVCRKDCSGMSTLELHMMSHTRGKPVTCVVCGKRFNLKCDLKTHMTTHTGERPFTCTVCGKSCGHRSNLKIHMRTHTGENPITCTVCGKGCINTSHLKIHMMTHMGE